MNNVKLCVVQNAHKKYWKNLATNKATGSWFKYMTYSPLHGFIWDQHIDRLPVGLLAQVVEHCTGIAEVMGSNSVQA